MQEVFQMKFKNVKELLEYTKSLAADTCQVLRLLGIPEKSGLFERWRELIEADAKEVLLEEVLEKVEQLEELESAADQLLSEIEDTQYSLRRASEGAGDIIARFKKR